MAFSTHNIATRFLSTWCRQTWGGVIGELGLEEGSSAADFYASYYNDHVRGRRKQPRAATG